MIKYSNEELVSYLQEFYYMKGCLPTKSRLKKLKGYPSIGTFSNRFGSLKNALIAADLYYLIPNEKMFNRKEKTKEDIINNYKVFIEKHERFPSATEQRNTSESGLYGANTVLKHFKNIQELKDVFGFTVEKEVQEENNLALASLKALYEKEGRISSSIIDKDPMTRSASFYSNRFGSLNKAYELAGIKLRKCRVSIPIIQLTKEGEFIKEWESAKKASLKLGTSEGNISHALRGRNPSAVGFKWVYKEDYDNNFF